MEYLKIALGKDSKHFYHKEWINDWGYKYGNYPDLIIIHYINVLKCLVYPVNVCTYYGYIFKNTHIHTCIFNTKLSNLSIYVFIFER